MQGHRALKMISIALNCRCLLFHKQMHYAFPGFKKRQRWRESSLFGSATDRPSLPNSCDGGAYHGMGRHSSPHGWQIVHGAYWKPKVIQWSSHRPKMHAQWKVIKSVLYCFPVHISIVILNSSLTTGYAYYRILGILKLKNEPFFFPKKRDFVS